MSNKNKNRSKRLNPQDRPKTTAIQDYDVTQSLNKMRQYSRRTRRSAQSDGTYSDDEQEYQRRKDYVSSNSSKLEGSTTGVPNWERYNRLEDRFTSFSDKNDKEHTALRMELESKIEKSAKEIKDDVRDLNQKLDKKLSIQWYSWTIGGIVAIAGLFWTLSYQGISKLPDSMNSLEKKVEKLESEVEKKSLISDTIYKNNEISRKSIAK